MIRHVLKDGTKLDDISGHVVRLDDAKAFYAILDDLEKERGKDDRTVRLSEP